LFLAKTPEEVFTDEPLDDGLRWYKSPRLRRPPLTKVGVNFPLFFKEGLGEILFPPLMKGLGCIFWKLGVDFLKVLVLC
jgi:hypothetical protein